MNKIKKNFYIRFAFYVVIVVAISRFIYVGSAWTYNVITGGDNSTYRLLHQFDASYYSRIIIQGYDLDVLSGGSANWAFFPLYPLIVRFLYNLTNLSLDILGFYSSTVFMAVGTFFAGLYMRETRSEKEAYFIVTLISFFPMSFYYSCLYTEGLYLMLLAIGFYCIYKKKWLMSGVIVAFASATRPTGVWLFIVIMIAVLKDKDFFEKGKTKDAVLNLLTDGKALLGLMISPLGAFIYMNYLYHYMGDGMAFSHIQRAWGKQTANPLITISNAIANGGINRYLAICCLIGIIIAVVSLIKGRYGEGIFLVLTITSCIFTSLNSIPRYVLGSLVPYFLMADIMGKYDARVTRIFEVTYGAVGILYLFLWYKGYGGLI